MWKPQRTAPPGLDRGHARAALLLGCVLAVAPAGETLAAYGDVASFQKISDTQGNFTGVLDDADELGFAVEVIGDLDDDGVDDLVVGARRDDDGGTDRGAVWVLFLNADDTVKSHQKISDLEGGFTGVLDDGDQLGVSVAPLGDLDGDGVEDLAVGARFDDDGGTNRGALWVLFLHANGTVKSHQKISDTEGGFTGSLDDFDDFARSASSLGDLDGDGIPDLAVGASLDDDGGFGAGAVWILFLDTDGTVQSHQKISKTAGNFGGTLANGDEFGRAVEVLGDLDGDDVQDLAVGAVGDDGNGLNRGALWILFLDIDGTVKSQQKIADGQGGFGGTLEDGDVFGRSVARLRGPPEMVLAVGADDDDGGTDRGAVWLLFVGAGGLVTSYEKVSDTQGGFTGDLDDGDRFGFCVTTLGDADGAGKLVVGARGDDDGGTDHGALWVLRLGSVPVPAGGNAARLAMALLLILTAAIVLRERDRGGTWPTCSPRSMR